MSGSWTATGEVVVVSTMAMTQMGCSPELMAQDTWLAQQFGKGMTVHLDGDTLTLTTVDGTVITLVDRKVAEPDLPLVGTTWTLESVITGDAATSYADVTATMTIEGDRIYPAATPTAATSRSPATRQPPASCWAPRWPARTTGNRLKGRWCPCSAGPSRSPWTETT